MDILDMLQALKGKVLDAAHFELLKHAYELQEQNINQLKSNNAAIRESNDLLKDKAEQLQKEVEQLRGSIETLDKQLSGPSSVTYSPSQGAAAILERYVKDDKNEFYDQQLFRLIRLSQIEVRGGLDELRQHKLIDFGAANHEGVLYYLTAAGRSFVLQSRGK